MSAVTTDLPIHPTVNRVIPLDNSMPIRDSMVSVSLSDVQSTSEQSQSGLHSPFEQVSPSSENPSENLPENLPAAITPPTELTSPVVQSEETIIQPQGVEENDLHDAAVWEELDKTEEQEPRTERTDEVCWILS